MIRYCPKKVKEKFKIGKFEVLDIVGFAITAVIILIILLFNGITTEFNKLIPKVIIALIVGSIGVLLNVPFEGDTPRLRSYVGCGFKFIFRHKKYESVKLEKDLGMTFKESDSHCVLYNASRNQYMLAVEIKANLFLLKDEADQDLYIKDLAKCFKYIKRGTILKVDMPINVGDYYVKNKEKQEKFYIIETKEKLYQILRYTINDEKVGFALSTFAYLLLDKFKEDSYTEEQFNVDYQKFKKLNSDEFKLINETYSSEDVYEILKNVIVEYLEREKNKEWNNALDLSQKAKNSIAERSMLLEEEGIIKDYLTHEYRNPRYFILLYSSKEEEIINDAYNLLSYLKESHFDAEICRKDTLKKMIKYYYDGAYDEDGDIVLNRWKETAGSIVMNLGKDSNGKNIYKKYHSYAINIMPRQTINAWIANLANLPGVKLSMKLKENDAIISSKNQLSGSILELKMQLNRPQKIYEREDINWQIEACNDLISELNAGNEVLRDCYIQFLVPDETNKEFLNQASMDNLHIDRLYFRQADTYLNNDVYKFMNTKPLTSIAVKLPSSIIGATYPFTYPTFFDGDGEFIGSSLGYPVFFDQFFNLNNKGSNLRVNANISITGTSGVGKSFLSKVLLLNVSSVADKIRILDPENEYDVLCQNLYGKNINVAGGDEIINPLQIFSTYGDGGMHNDVTMHKQFLDEFFKTCIRTIQQDDLLASYLNRCIDVLYSNWGYYDGVEITDDASKYPILQDLYDVINEQFLEETRRGNDYEAKRYKELLVLLSSFVRCEENGKKFEGSKSKMWNGHTTLKLDNRLIVFNFQNLLSSNNRDISAAQMLLIMKFLNQEVILNKNYNFAHNTENKVVIMVDEAHNFISKDYPVALTFLYKMSKQIRKYFGSLIVTTQQINDFLGGDENTAKLAKGIISNCQYSFIFGNPNAINEVQKLYGEISHFTDDEMEIIRNNKRGCCLFQLSPSCRTILDVSTSGNNGRFFSDKTLIDYFNSDECKNKLHNFVKGDVNTLTMTPVEEEKLEKEMDKEEAKEISSEPEIKSHNEEEQQIKKEPCKVVDQNGWTYYLSDNYKSLKKDACGRWKYTFNKFESAKEIAENAIENNICVEVKHTSSIVNKKLKEGNLFFYTNSTDADAHKRIISFMLQNNLLLKDKKRNYVNIEFFYDQPFITINGVEKKKKTIYLSDFIDLSSGELK